MASASENAKGIFGLAVIVGLIWGIFWIVNHWKTAIGIAAGLVFLVGFLWIIRGHVTTRLDRRPPLLWSGTLLCLGAMTVPVILTAIYSPTIMPTVWLLLAGAFLMLLIHGVGALAGKGVAFVGEHFDLTEAHRDRQPQRGRASGSQDDERRQADDEARRQRKEAAQHAAREEARRRQRKKQHAAGGPRKRQVPARASPSVRRCRPWNASG